MRDFIFGLSALGLCALTACATTGSPDGANKAATVLALADSARPQADKDRDAARKPGEMLEFAGIGPGTKVAEYAPGAGYFTRVFAKAVAPNGKVYAMTPPMRRGGPPPGGPPGGGGPPPGGPPGGGPPPGPPAVVGIAAEPTYGGAVVVVMLGEDRTLNTPEKVDVVWTSRNYHDLRERTDAFNKSVFDVLKPGGVYIVLDHSAGTDGAENAPSTLHRINPEFVKQQVTAAGFQLIGESNTLRNPADNLKQPVIEQGVRDHTDQFILKFRKP